MVFNVVLLFRILYNSTGKFISTAIVSPCYPCYNRRFRGLVVKQGLSTHKPISPLLTFKFTLKPIFLSIFLTNKYCNNILLNLVPLFSFYNKPDIFKLQTIGGGSSLISLYLGYLFTLSILVLGDEGVVVFRD